MQKFFVNFMTIVIPITLLIFGIANFNNGKIKRSNPFTDNPTTERERYMSPKKQDVTETLERKLSLKNVISFSKFKIDQLAHIEKTYLNIPTGHELLFLHSHQKLRLLSLIGIDLSRKPQLDRIYSIELLKNNNDGDYLTSVWAVHATSSTISVYIDDIKRQNDYEETKHGKFTIHSLPLIDPWISQPYKSISFYYDSNTIIIGSLDDLKIILDNQGSQNVWSGLDSEHSLAQFSVNNLQTYRSLTSGIIGAFDYDTFIKEAESFSVDIMEVVKDKSLQINLTVNTINEKTSSDSFNSELTTFKELLINRLKIQVTERLTAFKTPKTSVLLNSIKAMKVNQLNNVFTVKIPITLELFDFFNDNLITNVQNFILAFPGIVFADKYPAVNYQPATNQDVNDEIKTDLASYRERYRPVDSPKPRLDNFHKYSRTPNPYAHYSRSNLGSLLNLGISKIWFYDEQETQLTFEIEFQDMYPYESDWMTQHFKIGTLQFSTESQKIDVRTSYKETQENKLLKKNVLLTKGVMHRELTNITFNANLPVPKGVDSIVFTKNDIGKRVSIGFENTSIKLTSFEKHSISYIHTGPRHNIVEVRAFNKNSEALEVPSESTREKTYHNGQISTLKEYSVAGNIEFVEIFYVKEYSNAYSGKNSISPNIKSSVFPDGKHGLPLEPIAYAELQEKYFDQIEKKWIVPSLSDYDARDVKSGKYYSASVGPVRILIESKTSSEVFISTKFNGPAEKTLTTPSFLSIDIQQVIVDGVVHNRPSEQQIAKLEDNRNVNYNGYTKINWTINPRFSFHETGIDAEHIAPLGIKVSSDSSIVAFKANVTLLIPEQIETQTFKSIYVGDIISGDGYSYKVIKFESGRFFIRLDEGIEKFISIRASLNNERIIDNDIRYEQANIISIAPVSEKHSYRFLIAGKVHKEISTLQYGEFK